MKKSEYTILFKNVDVTSGKVHGRFTDFSVHETKVMATSSEQAEEIFRASRFYFVTSRKGAQLRRMRRYAIVRIFTGDRFTFKNYRGKTERKFVIVLPARPGKNIFHNWYGRGK
jgi:hypothetical protein